MIKQVFVPHPRNPNLEIEMHVQEEDPILIEGNDDDTPGSPRVIKEEPLPGSPKREFRDDPKWNRNQAILKKHLNARVFIGMIADASSISTSELLRDPDKKYSRQWVLDDDPETFEEFLQAILNPATYSGIVRTRDELQISNEITIEDLATSSLTRNKFAILVAEMSKQGVGGSAQPGRIYSTINGRTTRMAYNTHGGERRRSKNTHRIGMLMIWFTGVHKNDTLYYTNAKLY